jgi:dTDP-glucose pyrophosphorylase
MINWRNHVINDKSTIREAMLRLDSLGIVNSDIFIVDENEKLLGSVSDGDIRRALIAGAEMSDPVVSAMNINCIYSSGEHPKKEILQKCKSKTIRFLPLTNDNKILINIIDVDQFTAIVPVEAIIMAGGEGKRLKPLTDKIPKPLLPVGNKSIIEHNIDRLIRFGVTHIRISLNYLGHMIQERLGNGNSRSINISYVFEDKPLGTAGAVKTVNDWQTDNILVMNSDILTDVDYADFHADFIASGADMSIATTSYTINVPYAVLETGKANDVKALTEKPSYTYYSNAGIYLLNRKVLEFIPKNCFYDMTDLIQVLMNSKHKVSSYPIRGYWLDIGKPEDYKRAQDDIRHLDFYKF